MSGKTKISIAVLWFMVLLSVIWLFVPSVSTKGIGVFRWFNPEKVYISVDPSLSEVVWPVAEAAKFVDQYTASKMVFGNCRKGSRCITMRENPKLPITVAGRASWTRERLTVRVEFNSSYADKPHDALLRLVIHELGHTFGIHGHNPECTSVMFAYLTCGRGVPPPQSFTAEEIKTLERH